MTTEWIGPYENPLKAAADMAKDTDRTDKLHACVLATLEWADFSEAYLLDDLLQEIAGDTNIVLQKRDDGWYVADDAL